ncbi:MAG: substrate-binding domain-containing protein [Candidatus Nomurabacteria bacterium]|jgi:phosphate transport system substrate-binding protein|nr:substrate-binding domain-containing protein [Candidatus Nomurabacteria bacterium]
MNQEPANGNTEIGGGNAGFGGGGPAPETTANIFGDAPNQPPATPKKDKKGLIILIVGLFVILSVTAVACWFILKPTDDNITTTQTETVSGDPIFTKDDYPRVDASTATQPLAVAYYNNFTGEKSIIADFDFTKTHEAYVRLINGEADLILVTQPSADEQNLAKEKGVELQVTPVTNEGFVFFVSSANPVDNLTTDQVQKIYTGEITNWKEVGGNDQAILAYQRPENSGSQTGMLELVMKGKKMAPPLTESLRVSSMEAIIDAVSSYETSNSDAGIGYSYYYYATTIYQNIDKNTADGVKLLAIDGVKPEPSTIKSKTYPFQTSYFIVTTDQTSENTQKLKEAMLSKRGQQVAEEAKYVPAN